MARRIDPRQVAKLVEVQRVRRAAADAALAIARDGEDEARQAETSALGDAAVARDDWFACLDHPGFAPEYWRALADRLTARDMAVTDAAARLAVAANSHARRQDDWRAAEARVQLTEQQHRTAMRDAARRREELRLDDLSYRITRRAVAP